MRDIDNASERSCVSFIRQKQWLKPIFLSPLYLGNLLLKNRVRALIITGEIMAVFWDEEISEEPVASVLRVKTKSL
jgi:hypothetical protein